MNELIQLGLNIQRLFIPGYTLIIKIRDNGLLTLLWWILKQGWVVNVNLSNYGISYVVQLLTQGLSKALTNSEMDLFSTVDLLDQYNITNVSSRALDIGFLIRLQMSLLECPLPREHPSLVLPVKDP